MDEIEFEAILLRFGATMRAFGKLKSKANKKEQPIEDELVEATYEIINYTIKDNHIQC